MIHTKRRSMLKDEIIKSICQWNEDRGNKEYSVHLEFEMLQEEVMEYVHAFIKTVGDNIKDIEFENEELREQYVSALVEKPEFTEELLVNQADALCDVVFVAVGGLYKLFGDAELVNRALTEVICANEQKSKEKDENGKITKPADFVGPEEELLNLVRSIDAR